MFFIIISFFIVSTLVLLFLASRDLALSSGYYPPETKPLKDHYHSIMETMNNESAIKVKTILLIDDNEMDLMVIRQTITSTGFRGNLLSEKSGASALEYLKKNSDSPDKLPDLIFLDIYMPEMNGFEFLDEFALLPPAIRNKSAIVMLTSSSDANDLKRSIESRFVRKFINKPLTPDEVITTLAEIQALIQQTFIS